MKKNSLSSLAVWAFLSLVVCSAVAQQTSQSQPAQPAPPSQTPCAISASSSKIRWIAGHVRFYLPGKAEQKLATIEAKTGIHVVRDSISLADIFKPRPTQPCSTPPFVETPAPPATAPIPAPAAPAAPSTSTPDQTVTKPSNS
jgi:hypothetical protein